MIIVGSLSNHDNDADAESFFVYAWVCNLLAFIICFPT